MSYRDNREKNSEDAENNTAVASAGNNGVSLSFFAMYELTSIIWYNVDGT